MPHLFEPLRQRDVNFRNRIAVSPMCQYSSQDGHASDWHLVHLGSRAAGGAAAILTEATAVSPEGRISPQDLGIWKDEHIEMLVRMTHFVRGQGAVAGMQLAHAGRKASTWAPGQGTGAIAIEAGGWQPVAPSALAFAPDYAMPRALDATGMRKIIADFAAAAQRALAAGFQLLELHAAHGYLLHEFLSPLSNQRTDAYGGILENRCRLVCEVTAAVRGVWPERLPLWVRISASDWSEGGWDVEASIELARRLRPLGVDLVDCSSGGNVATAKIPLGAGYQTGFAERIRRESGMPTGAVGMITAPAQADHILRSGQADMVIMAREMLRDPYWPLRAGRELGAAAAWPAQYLRAAPAGSPAQKPSEDSGQKFQNSISN